ncbi:hypothetical protein RIF29_25844 [Crotalaria pallida]|uniref:Uncharacterized protein n=1 Tax=Crotalaria pallida TaxID=3830 RepID=A0AAN9HXS0_CROPI
MQAHCEDETVSIVQESQIDKAANVDNEVEQGNDQKEGQSTPVENDDRIVSKLDRVLVNYIWCREWPDVQTEFGNCGISDHSPMVIRWSNYERCKGYSFKFLNHLTLGTEFIEIVKQNWLKGRDGCAMYRIMRNLENIKAGLKELNHRKFRDIDAKEIQAREKLDSIQEMLQTDPMNVHLLKLEKEAKEEHAKLYQVAAMFLKQKAKQNWICEGDMNTKFFHQTIRLRRYRNRILRIQESNGSVYTVQKQIVQAFESYYKSLFADENRIWCLNDNEEEEYLP